MLTGTYFYAFTGRGTPILKCYGVRFELLEVANTTFDELQFKILCWKHDELKKFPLKHFKQAVLLNF
jgi:hypothetical protein